MAMQTVLENFRTQLPATGDSCILCEQRPLEHSVNGIPWSCQMTLPLALTKAYTLAQASTYLISHNNPRRWGTEIQSS